MKKILHIHCPVNGWDCPYYTDEGQPCRCLLDDPYNDCDDFAAMWDKDDDYIDRMYYSDDEEYIDDASVAMRESLGNNWW